MADLLHRQGDIEDDARAGQPGGGECLKRAAAEIAETGTIRRHDVAGRIFHRLLDTRKFLATNYTTIPAAIMLAGLAFDERSECWSGIDFADAQSFADLRIVDPACGSGTLLMAAAQEILKRGRQAGSDDGGEREVVRSILERGRVRLRRGAGGDSSGGFDPLHG